MALVAKSAVLKTKDVIADNAETKGRRIVTQQAMGLVASVVAAVLALYASLHTEEECSSSPMKLKDWFLGLFAIQVCSVWLFVCTMYAVLSIMGSTAKRLRLSLSIGLHFADGEEAPASPIVKVEVYSARFVDRIVFHRADGTTTTKGHAVGQLQEVFLLAPHEHISEISGTQNKHLDSVQFRTNFGRTSRVYGHADVGRDFLVRASPGREICDYSQPAHKVCAIIKTLFECSVLDPLPAQEEVEVAGRTVTQVEVLSSPEVHQITFRYSDGTSSSTGPASEGAHPHEPFVLEEGEYIVSVRGRQAMALYEIAFVTNTGRASPMYGQSEAGHGQAFWQSAPAGRQIWALTRVPGEHGGPVAAVVEAAVAAPQPVDPVDPVDPEQDEEAYVVCCASFVLFLFVVLAFLCFFLVVWGVVGLLSVIDANSEQNGADCETGRLYFWILVVLTYLNVCWCKGGAVGDLLLGVEWPALLSVPKRRQEGQVEVSV